MVLLALALSQFVFAGQVTALPDDPKWGQQLARVRQTWPGQPTPLLDGTRLREFHARNEGGLSDRLTSRLVPVANQPFGLAVQVKVGASSNPYYTYTLRSPATALPIQKGDTVLLRYSLRCLSTRSSTGRGRFEGYVQTTGTPWQMLGRFQASAGPRWEHRVTTFVATEDWPAGSLELTFHLGQYVQVLEFGGITMEDLGPRVAPAQVPLYPITYAGRERSAPWRKEAERNIDRYRKANLTVKVLDARGREIPDAQVRARMTRHAYAFGTFMDSATLRKNADGQRYRAAIKQNFNLVTAPFFWIEWWFDNEENRVSSLRMATWAQTNGLRMRGNNLIVPGWRWSPSWLRTLEKDPHRLNQVVRSSIAERVALFRPFGLEEVDALTELRMNPEFAQILGWPRVGEWMTMAHSLNPSMRLAVNEDSILEQGGNTEGNQDALEADLRRFRTGNIPINAIGLESRFTEELTPPDTVRQILNRFARYDMPISATELMIDIADEQVQADYLRDFMTVFFAHPSTWAIVQWGFWEGQHWLPQAALYRRDWSEKPALKAYRELVFGKWWTQAVGKSDARGQFNVRGFQGDYVIEVTVGKRTTRVPCTLGKAGRTVIVRPGRT